MLSNLFSLPRNLLREQPHPAALFLLLFARIPAILATATGFWEDNDSYHALQAIDGLIATGPTGTNVNDVAIALLAE